MSNIRTVQSIYEAFGRGDIATILGHLAEDVTWEYDKAEAGIPWLAPRRGRAAVPKFFEALGAVDFQQFQPKMQFESGNTVKWAQRRELHCEGDRQAGRRSR
ncbi:MAG: nuclear transport factor 2 family protein [Rhizobacter sp.]|nr:nuclear transport factor 2 family protein [Rhizobacter sp.]